MEFYESSPENCRDRMRGRTHDIHTHNARFSTKRPQNGYADRDPITRAARGRPIIVEWERRKAFGGLSRSVTHRYVTERYTFQSDSQPQPNLRRCHVKNNVKKDRKKRESIIICDCAVDLSNGHRRAEPGFVNRLGLLFRDPESFTESCDREAFDTLRFLLDYAITTFGRGDKIDSACLLY
ncbi:hypothetical protein EVAR_25680_1 [Eumeta japonica]|uniref:Uncharacterized protein n=1 Tax=Eumeta variegata TaxID=151549 RepID=A0A4C1WDJ4_EUMVA|nr:hypothetical protein EVAR_25680_1 [Eumeta japonica]